jgi:hypothetical protein
MIGYGPKKKNMIDLKPPRGGFLRPFGCGWFIREYLLGNGPEGSIKIDPQQGAPQSDINFAYKEALAKATARGRAEEMISQMVLSGKDITEEKAEEIFQRELKKVSRKFTHIRYHSFLVYFGILKRLGWVEPAGITEPSAIQDNYTKAPDRVYYRLSKRGMESGAELWLNPLFTLYPNVGPSHTKKPN